MHRSVRLGTEDLKDQEVLMDFDCFQCGLIIVKGRRCEKERSRWSRTSRQGLAPLKAATTETVVIRRGDDIQNKGILE
jgi:hypothetical protein